MALKEIDKEEWIQLIDSSLGKRKKYSLESRQSFALSLLNNIPKGLEQIEKFAPSNDDVKRLRKFVEKLNDAAFDLYEQRKGSSFLQDVETWTSGLFIETRGIEINIKTLWDYAYFLSNFIEDTSRVTSVPGRNNRSELMTCMTICKAYESIFNDIPTVSREDFQGQSGSIEDGTPYERVCGVVEKYLLDLELPWSTQKQAVENYKGDSFFYKRMFPDDKIASFQVEETRMKSPEK